MKFLKFLSNLKYKVDDMKLESVIIIDIGKKSQNGEAVERYYYDVKNSEGLTLDLEKATVFKNNNEAIKRANELYISINENEYKYSYVNITICTVPKSLEELKIRKNIQSPR